MQKEKQYFLCVCFFFSQDIHRTNISLAFYSIYIIVVYKNVRMFKFIDSRNADLSIHNSFITMWS